MSNECHTHYYNLSLDTTDEEARSQFLEEIEIMKAIGSHKNIVSMLGCWVHSDPIFLILEYVPYGDLQHWLRNKRIQVDVTLIRNLYEETRTPMTFYLTKGFHVAVRLFSNRSQMTSKCSKNKQVAHEAIAECVTDVLTTF